MFLAIQYRMANFHGADFGTKLVKEATGIIEGTVSRDMA